MKKSLLISMGVAAVALTLGTIQASGQATMLFDFSDNTSQGWANAGFASTPQASLTTHGTQNYISVNFVGYQSANVASSSQIGGNPYSEDDYLSPALNAQFNAAMYDALLHPAASTLSFDWYVDTSLYVGSTPPTFVQIGAFVNPESGFYAQYQSGTQLDGTQTASGGIYSGTITMPFSVFGTDANAASEVGFRLGLIVNEDSTSQYIPVEFTNIKIVGAPEPATLAMCGMGLLGSLLALRRRRS